MTGTRLADLWSLLPAELAPLLRPRVSPLARDIIEEIQRRIPVLARPVDSSFGRALTEGVQEAVLLFIDRVADPQAPQEDRARLFREMGLQRIVADGPSLDVLQMAYRVGAQVAWRQISQLCERARVPIGTQVLIAEAIFAYIDELSALAIEGHTSADDRAAGALERRRRQLLELILSGPESTASAIEGLADAVGWPVPDRVVAVALELREGEPEGCAPNLDPRILLDLEGSRPCLLVSELDKHVIDKLGSELPGWRAAAGPGVPLARARESLSWARRTISLVQQGVLPDMPVTWFDEHMSALWLLGESLLVRELSRRALAPLAGLTSKQHAKLSETLLTWLETRGSAEEIGALLEVHPQTVRYRMRQLEKLFGPRLETPGSRFELEVTLRARRSSDGSDLLPHRRPC